MMVGRMVSDAFTSYDSGERVIYGMMPILGSAYSLIKFFGFRSDGEKQDAVRREREAVLEEIEGAYEDVRGFDEEDRLAQRNNGNNYSQDSLSVPVNRISSYDSKERVPSRESLEERSDDEGRRSYTPRQEKIN